MLVSYCRCWWSMTLLCRGSCRRINYREPWIGTSTSTCTSTSTYVSDRSMGYNFTCVYLTLSICRELWVVSTADNGEKALEVAPTYHLLHFANTFITITITILISTTTTISTTTSTISISQPKFCSTSATCPDVIIIDQNMQSSGGKLRGLSPVYFL